MIWKKVRKIGKLDLEEQLELVSDYNDALMERIVSFLLIIMYRISTKIFFKHVNQNLTLDEAAGLKKQAETVMVEMMAKTNNLNGSWNRHSVSLCFINIHSLVNIWFLFSELTVHTCQTSIS